MFHTSIRQPFYLLAITFITLLTTALGAASSLDEQINGSCKSIAKYLKSESSSSIAIGGFNGPGIGGISIAAKFETTLKALKLQVVPDDEDYDFKVQGKYKLFPASLEEFEEIDIEIELVNELGAAARQFNETYVFSIQNGNVKQEFKPADGKLKLKSIDPPEMSVLLGKSTQFGNTGKRPSSSQHRDKLLDKLKQTLEEQPHPSVGQNHLVRLSDDSPYGIQIFSNGHPMTVTQSKSKVRVVIPKGQVFSIVVQNDDSYDTAVEISLDGVNSFAFSEIKAADGVSPAYKHWIVPRGSPAEVQGWFVSHEEIDLFKVTGFKDSAVFKAKGKADKLSGTIVATFRYAWAENEPPPPEAFIGRGDADQTFIGFGGRKRVKTEKVNRHIGPVREVIVIHYRSE